MNDISLIQQKFITATNVEDYIGLIGDRLEHHNLVYVLLSADSMETQTATQCRVALRRLCQQLAARDAPTVLRILVTAHGAVDTEELVEDACFRAGRLTKTAAKGRSRGLRRQGAK